MRIKLTHILVFLFLCIQNIFAISPSGTLPVLYIETDNSIEVPPKNESYVNGIYWIEVPDDCQFPSIGSKEYPLGLSIKGRGNWTWSFFEKKPYKIKLNVKQPLLGMAVNAHWALLAHADDKAAFLNNHMGFQTSKMLNMEWTPSDQPVELILNGDYRGLYFLTENIRADKNRLNIDYTNEPFYNVEDIAEQAWLMEIDNYDDSPNFSIRDKNNKEIIFTYNQPENPTLNQINWIRSEMEKITNILEESDPESTKWEDYIDAESAAKFFIVHEIMDNQEAYVGSWYIYKHKGEKQKWKFGPVWDFGYSLLRHNKNFTFRNEIFYSIWIRDLVKFNSFREKVKSVWAQFVSEHTFDDCQNLIENWVHLISPAHKKTIERWPEYSSENLTDSEIFSMRLAQSIRWCGEKFGIQLHNTPEYIPLYIEVLINGQSQLIPLENITQHLFIAEDINLSAGCKIRIRSEDERFVNIGLNNWETPEISLDEPLKLNSQGNYIKLSQDYENITLIYDHEECHIIFSEKKWNDLNSIPETEELKLRISNNIVSSDIAFSVYSIDGTMIAQNTQETVLRPGIYIIVQHNKVSKLLLQ